MNMLHSSVEGALNWDATGPLNELPVTYASAGLENTSTS